MNVVLPNAIEWTIFSTQKGYIQFIIIESDVETENIC